MISFLPGDAVIGIVAPGFVPDAAEWFQLVKRASDGAKHPHGSVLSDTAMRETATAQSFASESSLTPSSLFHFLFWAVFLAIFWRPRSSSDRLAHTGRHVISKMANESYRSISASTPLISGRFAVLARRSAHR